MTFGRRRHRRRAPAISVVSMADIAFILIVFFMVTTSFTRGPQLEVQLPTAETGEPPAVPTAITISVGRDGTFAIDGREAPRELLGDLLRPLVGRLEQPAVVVAADKGVAWEEVVYAMDSARGIGVTQLELSVRDPAR